MRRMYHMPDVYALKSLLERYTRLVIIVMVLFTDWKSTGAT